jgi:hypothetical protein
MSHEHTAYHGPINVDAEPKFSKGNMPMVFVAAFVVLFPLLLVCMFLLVGSLLRI